MTSPQVGDMVHYHWPQSGNNQPFAAVVTHVWDDLTVNLYILSDATFPTGSAYLDMVRRGVEPGQWSLPRAERRSREDEQISDLKELRAKGYISEDQYFRARRQLAKDNGTYREAVS